MENARRDRISSWKVSILRTWTRVFTDSLLPCPSRESLPELTDRKRFLQLAFLCQLRLCRRRRKRSARVSRVLLSRLLPVNHSFHIPSVVSSMRFSWSHSIYFRYRENTVLFFPCAFHAIPSSPAFLEEQEQFHFPHTVDISLSFFLKAFSRSSPVIESLRRLTGNESENPSTAFPSHRFRCPNEEQGRTGFLNNYSRGGEIAPGAFANLVTPCLSVTACILGQYTSCLLNSSEMPAVCRQPSYAHPRTHMSAHVCVRVRVHTREVLWESRNLFSYNAETRCRENMRWTPILPVRDAALRHLRVNAA